MTKNVSKKYEKFVEITSPNTKQKYNVPTELKDSNISTIIRTMFANNYTKAEIAKLTNIRYQHVRNVLNQPLKK